MSDVHLLSGEEKIVSDSSVPSSMKNKLYSENKTELYGYAVSITLCIVITTIILQLWNVDLTLPLRYGGDALFNLAFVKGIIDNGWYQENVFLGAPFKSHLYDYPMGADNFHHLCFKILSFFTDNYALIINIYFLFTFPLATASSYYVFRKFNISIPVAVLISLLFTFLPYHFNRGTGHLFLAAYYMVPFAILIGLYILLNKDIFLTRNSTTSKIKLDFKRNSILAFIVCGLIASTGVYYAFFTSMLFGVTGLIVALEKRDLLTFLRTGVFCSAILAVSVINVSPSIVYKSINGENPELGKRYPYEAEFYGLRIAQLVLPATNHRVESFSKLREEYKTKLRINENDFVTLGLFGTVGFLILLAAVFIKRGRDKELFWNLSRLNLIAVLFATLGGFGALFSLLVMPYIRGQNRICVFIAFIAFFALGIILDQLTKRIKRQEIKVLVLSVILVIGIWDQTSSTFAIDQEVIKKRFQGDRNFFATIQNSLPEHSKILQLPHLPYIEFGRKNHLTDYEPFKGYLHSENLYWSYGAPRGRRPDKVLSFIASLEPEKMVSTASYIGFNGLYIDRFGYNDNGKSLEAGLRRILGVSPIESEDGRLLFFNLNGYKGIWSGLDAEKVLSAFNIDNATKLNDHYLLRGWSKQETTHRWTSGKFAELFIPVKEPAFDVKLNVHMFPLLKQGVLDVQRVIVRFNDTPIGEWKVTKEDTCSIVIDKELMADIVNIVSFELPDAATPKSLGKNQDERELAVGVKGITLTEVK